MFDMIDIQKKELDEKEALLDREEKLFNRQDELAARRKFAGNSLAGQQTQNQSPEEMKKEQAKTFFKGTALEEAIDKYNG